MHFCHAQHNGDLITMLTFIHKHHFVFSLLFDVNYYYDDQQEAASYPTSFVCHLDSVVIVIFVNQNFSQEVSVPACDAVRVS